jgi:hypothetical protein
MWELNVSRWVVLMRSASGWETRYVTLQSHLAKGTQRKQKCDVNIVLQIKLSFVPGTLVFPDETKLCLVHY